MDFLKCLEDNNLMLPNYDEYSIVDLMKTVYNYCGGYSVEMKQLKTEMEKYIKNKKHILFVLVDGMGSNLINSLPNGMLLKDEKQMDLLTVFPTTTGCVLSSIATAEYPSKHGIIGWYNYNRTENINYCPLLFKERETKKNLNLLEIKEKDIFQVESIMNMLKRKTTAVFPEKIVNSEFSKYMLKQNRIGYSSIEEAFFKVSNMIKENLDIETFTYLYISDIDSKSHTYGVYSKQVREVVDEIEKQLIKLKKQNIEDLEIIIVADHGQIDVTEEDVVMNFEKYNNYFYALPGIDYGTATYYVKEDNKVEFLKEFKKDYEGMMYIFETEEFIKNNVFGENNISPYMKSNLGEYISFCKKGAYFVNDTGEAKKYIGKVKGSHSGLSREELMVPLIVINS